MATALSGIDGRNPCGFLAALGMLRLLADHPDGDDARLAWRAGEAGAPHPTISFTREKSEGEVVRMIMDSHLARDLDAELGWEADVMKLSCEEVRRLLASSADPDAIRAAQTIGGCAVDVPRRRHPGKVDPDRLTPYTPLRLIPRVGRARFLSTALSISKAVTEQQIHAALFGPWRYEKANSMRWDPGAPPALRAYSAEAPTNFGPLGVPGAIALAAAGLCYFPLLATSGGKASCRGFDFPTARILRWPLWTPPLDEPATRITLGLPALHDNGGRPSDWDSLRRHGVFARVSARRERLGDDDEMLSWGEVETSSSP